MTIKKSYLIAFEKASKTTYFQDLRKFEGKTFEETSRFSGETVELNALEATIYEFCLNWYKRYEQGRDCEVPVSTYDNMRNYLLFLNVRAYMDLLDEFAMDLASEVKTKAQLKEAVETHLLNDFHPPFPASMTGTCVRAIEYAKRGEWDKKVLLPEGMSYKGKRLAPIEAVIEAHRLELFIDEEEEDED